MNTLNVLIADDIIINRILIKEILSDFECYVIEAENGKVAIDLLQNQKIDLILLDIEMPVMNGLETVKYIREKLSSPLNEIPVIALTAHDPALYFADFKEVGFDGLLTKPYTYFQMKYIIETFF